MAVTITPKTKDSAVGLTNVSKPTGGTFGSFPGRTFGDGGTFGQPGTFATKPSKNSVTISNNAKS